MSDLQQLLEQLVEERLAPLRQKLAELEAANQQPAEALAFTLSELAARFLPGVPESTLRDWIKSGELVGHLTPGGRVYLVYMDDLRALLSRLQAKKPDAAERHENVADNVRRILAKHGKRTTG